MGGFKIGGSKIVWLLMLFLTPQFVFSAVPVVQSARIEPQILEINGTLAGFCNATDADGDDVFYYYRWYRNDTILSSGNTSHVIHSTLNSMGASVTSVLSYNGKLYSGSTANLLSVFNQTTRRPITNITYIPDQIRSLAANDDYIFVGSGSGILYIINQTNYKSVYNISGHTGYVIGLNIDDKYIYSGESAGTYDVHVHNITDFSSVVNLTNPGNIIYGIGVYDDLLSVASRDTNLYVYNITDWSLNATFTDTPSYVISTYIDDKFIYSGGQQASGNEIFRYNKTTLTLIDSAPLPAGQSARGFAVDLHNNYLYVAADGAIYVYDRYDLTLGSIFTLSGSAYGGVNIDNDFIVFGGTTNVMQVRGKYDYEEGLEINIGGTEFISDLHYFDSYILSCRGASNSTEIGDWVNSTALENVFDNNVPETTLSYILPQTPTSNDNLLGYCFVKDNDGPDNISYNYKWYVNGNENKTGSYNGISSTLLETETGNYNWHPTRWLATYNNIYDNNWSTYGVSSGGTGALTHLWYEYPEGAFNKTIIWRVKSGQSGDNWFVIPDVCRSWNTTHIKFRIRSSDSPPTFGTWSCCLNASCFSGEEFINLLDEVGAGAAHIYEEELYILEEPVSNLTSNYTVKGQDWTFSCNGYDGFNSSEYLNSTEVTILNGVPYVINVSITPDNPSSGDVLGGVCNSEDPDGDSITYNWIWYKDGVNYSYGTGSVGLVLPSETQTGQIWILGCRVNDSEYFSDWVNSTFVNLTNGAPNITQIFIQPDPANTLDNLSGYCNTTDYDNDSVFYEYKWYINDILVKNASIQYNTSLTYDLDYVNVSSGAEGEIAFAPNATYDLQVCVNDGTSDIIESCKTYTAGEYKAGDSLETNVVTLLKDEQYRISLHWKKIRYIDMNDSNLDGKYDHGEILFSDVYSTCNLDTNVQNAYSPTQADCEQERVFSGGLTGNGGALTGFNGAFDSDTSTPYDYVDTHWAGRKDYCRIYEGYDRVGGTNASLTCSNLPYRVFGGVWTAGTHWILTSCSNGVKDSCPSTIYTYAGTTTDYTSYITLDNSMFDTATSSTYIDTGGNITWTNTTLNPYPSNELILVDVLGYEYTSKFDNVTFSCRSYDSYNYSEWVNSTTITIENINPVVESVNIVTSTNYTYDTLEGWCNVSDIDADNITYQYTWYNGSVNYSSGFSGPYIHNVEVNIDNITKYETKKHDTWVLSCRGTDGYSYSDWTNSTSVTILNYIPIITNVSFLPNTPYTNDTLIGYCNALDYDNDDVSYNWVWYRNGSNYTYGYNHWYQETEDIYTNNGDTAWVNIANAFNGDWGAPGSTCSGNNCKSEISYTKPDNATGGRYIFEVHHNSGANAGAQYLFKCKSDLEAPFYFFNNRDGPGTTINVSGDIPSYCYEGDSLKLIIQYYIGGTVYIGIFMENAVEWYTAYSQNESINVKNISSANTEQYENWTFGCKARDDENVSIWYNSTTKQINNNIPTITSVEYIPQYPKNITPINCTFEVYDLDDDELNVNVTWYKSTDNGQIWTHITTYDYTYNNVTYSKLYNTSVGTGSLPDTAINNYDWWKCGINVTDGFIITNENSTVAKIHPLENLTIISPENNTISNQPINVTFTVIDYDEGIHCNLTVNGSTAFMNNSVFVVDNFNSPGLFEAYFNSNADGDITPDITTFVEGNASGAAYVDNPGLFSISWWWDLTSRDLTYYKDGIVSIWVRINNTGPLEDSAILDSVHLSIGNDVTHYRAYTIKRAQLLNNTWQKFTWDMNNPNYSTSLVDWTNVDELRITSKSDQSVDYKLNFDLYRIFGYNNTYPNGSVNSIIFTPTANSHYDWNITCSAQDDVITSENYHYIYDTQPPIYNTYYNSTQTDLYPEINNPINLSVDVIENLVNIEYCQYWINDNNSWWMFTEDYINDSSGSYTYSTTFTVRNISTANNSIVYWRVWCNDTAQNYAYSENRSFEVVDLHFPLIISDPNNIFTNNRTIIAGALYNLSYNFTYFDYNLFQTEVNVSCEINGTIYYDNVLDWNVTTGNMTGIVDLSNLPLQKCTIYTAGSDDHTAKLIPLYKEKKLSKGFEFETEAKNKIQIISEENQNNIKSVKTQKKEDRYTFDFEFEDTKSNRIFTVKSDNKLYPRENSLYPGHFVSWNPSTHRGNWIDFAELDNTNLKYTITRVSDYEYTVEVEEKVKSGGIKKLGFNSIGGTNIENRTWEFYIGGYVDISTLNLFDNGTYVNNFQLDINTINSYPGFNGSFNVSGNTERVENISNGTYYFNFTHNAGEYFNKNYLITISNINQSLVYTTYQSVLNVIGRNIKILEPLVNLYVNVTDTSTNYSLSTNNTDDITTVTTFYLNASVYFIYALAEGYEQYNTTINITYLQNLTLYADMTFFVTFLFIDERTLEPFNMSEPETIRFRLDCFDNVFDTVIISNITTLPINCEYEKFTFFVEYPSDSYYRTFIFPSEAFNESFNLSIYLIDAYSTPISTVSFVVDDLLQEYDNPRVYVKKVINERSEQITADYVDIEDKITAFLIRNHEYQIEIESDNKPLRSVGPYSAVESSAVKNIRLYNIGLGSQPNGYTSSVRYTSQVVNLSGTQYIAVVYQDDKNLTDSVTVNIYQDTYNGTLVTTSTFSGEYNIEFLYNISSLINHTLFAEIIYDHSLVGEKTSVNRLNQQGLKIILPFAEYLGEDTLNWIITFLLSVLAIMATAKSANVYTITLLGFSALFIVFGWYTLSWGLWAVTLLVALLSMLNKGEKQVGA